MCLFWTAKPEKQLLESPIPKFNFRIVKCLGDVLSPSKVHRDVELQLRIHPARLWNLYRFNWFNSVAVFIVRHRVHLEYFVKFQRKVHAAFGPAQKRVYNNLDSFFPFITHQPKCICIQSKFIRMIWVFSYFSVFIMHYHITKNVELVFFKGTCTEINSWHGWTRECLRGPAVAQCSCKYRLFFLKALESQCLFLVLLRLAVWMSVLYFGVSHGIPPSLFHTTAAEELCLHLWYIPRLDPTFAWTNWGIFTLTETHKCNPTLLTQLWCNDVWLWSMSDLKSAVAKIS